MHSDIISHQIKVLALVEQLQTESELVQII
jgi:hypothetical protein